MQNTNSKNPPDGTIAFLAYRYSRLGILFITLVITAGIMILLSRYISNLPTLTVICLALSIVIVFLFGYVSEFAYNRGGSTFAFFIRFLLLLSIIYMSVLLFMVHWSVGIAGLFAITIVYLHLKEICTTSLKKRFSSRDQMLFPNSVVERKSFGRTLEKLAQEVILGPGYVQKTIGDRIEDIKLSMNLGKKEFEKGKQESGYIDMTRKLSLINARLKNISTEEMLQRLQTKADIDKLNFQLKKLENATSVSNLLNESKKSELMIQIVNYRLYISKLARMWKSLHSRGSTKNETGFE